MVHTMSVGLFGEALYLPPSFLESVEDGTSISASTLAITYPNMHWIAKIEECSVHCLCLQVIDAYHIFQEIYEISRLNPAAYLPLDRIYELTISCYQDPRNHDLGAE